MACQYATDNAQHDWRNAQYGTYNMFQQSAYNQDVARSDYSSLFDPNYALAQAQMAHTQSQIANAHAQSQIPTTHSNLSGRKDIDGKNLGNSALDTASSSPSWNKNGTWNHSATNSHADSMHFNVEPYQQNQYSITASKNYWA